MHGATLLQISLVVLVLMTASCRPQPQAKNDDSKLLSKPTLETAADVQPDENGWVVAAGDTIPALEFVDSSGKTRSLDEFQGKPVVLLFWGST